MARWLIRVTGKQRREVDIDLIVQAVIVLGHQLAEEEKGTEGNTKARVVMTPTATLVTKEDAS